MKREKKYTLKELVTFGKYLLSDTRALRIITHSITSGENIKERLQNVHDADIANWRDEELKNKTHGRISQI